MSNFSNTLANSANLAIDSLLIAINNSAVVFSFSKLALLRLINSLAFATNSKISLAMRSLVKAALMIGSNHSLYGLKSVNWRLSNIRDCALFSVSIVIVSSVSFLLTLSTLK